MIGYKLKKMASIAAKDSTLFKFLLKLQKKNYFK